MKFYGFVGYSTTVEETGDREGNWIDKVIEKRYYGDIIRNNKRWDANTESINDNLNISNTISIAADMYAYNHFSEMKYVVWMGVRWKIQSVEVQRPRLILSIGGVYNGPTPSTPPVAEESV